MYEDDSDSKKSEYVLEEKEEEIEKPNVGKKNKKQKEKIIYLNNRTTMQRETSDKVFLGNTVFSFNDVGRSSAIDRTASNKNDAWEIVKKIRELISTGQYDEDIKKYIHSLLELKFQCMLEHIDTRY